MLPALVLAQLAGTSPWFAVNAVMPELQARFGGAAAEVGTLAAAASAASGFWALWGWRAATGFCLAGIHPVGMKIAAQWFPQGLGPALGLWMLRPLLRPPA